MENGKLSFSEVIKQFIQTKGIKNKEIADKTGYSAAYISDLLSGERRWNEDTIGKVCEVLGVEINFEPVEKGEIAETTIEG